MEQFSKDIVKKLLERATSKITKEKDAKIKELEVELETIKLEKILDSEFNTKETKQTTDEVDVDKILGGLYE